MNQWWRHAQLLNFVTVTCRIWIVNKVKNWKKNVFCWFFSQRRSFSTYRENLGQLNWNYVLPQLQPLALWCHRSLKLRHFGLFLKRRAWPLGHEKVSILYRAENKKKIKTYPSVDRLTTGQKVIISSSDSIMPHAVKMSSFTSLSRRHLRKQLHLCWTNTRLP